MQSDEKKSVGFLNCKVLPEMKSSQSYEKQNVVPCEFLKQLTLHVSAFEGGIFANVSTLGEKLLLLYIVLDVCVRERL